MSNSLQIVSASVSDRGLSEKRPQNEDSFLDMPHRGIFAVADGVGGAEAGEVASQMAMDILGEAFVNSSEGADAEDVMRNALQQANSAIHEMSTELPQLSRMATTVVALHISGNIATIGHVGDSRLYRVDREGKIYRETADHSVVAEEVRAGRMTEEQAENHPSKNIISRALGAEPTVDVDLKTMMFDGGTSFLLCSDGVTRHIPDGELQSFLAAGAEPATVCEHIKALCYERGAEDNLTAVIIHADGEAEDAKTLPLLPIDHMDEPTIATARVIPTQPPAKTEDDELLEIGTADLTIPEESTIEPNPPEKVAADAVAKNPFAEPATVFSKPDESNTPPTIQISGAERKQDPQLSMFGDAGDRIDEEKSGLAMQIVKSFGLLLIGGIIGLAAYHFLLAGKIAPQSVPLPTEMNSGNQPLTAFEENRRTVDKMPKEALAKFGADPQDAEDFFLVGRADLLLGKSAEARQAFTTAKQRIAEGKVDPNNQKNIETEIAIELTVINNSTIQSILEKNLNPPKPAGNANSNGNSNLNK